MDDGKQRKANDSIWSQTKVVTYLVGVIVLVIGLGYFFKYGDQARGLTKDWFLIAIGAALVAIAVWEISSGTALFDEVFEFKRSEDPLLYWLVILSGFVLGGLMIVGPVGEMFGLWQW